MNILRKIFLLVAGIFLLCKMPYMVTKLDEDDPKYVLGEFLKPNEVFYCQNMRDVAVVYCREVMRGVEDCDKQLWFLQQDEFTNEEKDKLVELFHSLTEGKLCYLPLRSKISIQYYHIYE